MAEGSVLKNKWLLYIYQLQMFLILVLMIEQESKG